MTASISCPRCGGALRPPGLWSSAWQCERDGEVLPLHVARHATQAGLDQLVEKTRVPVWIPHPFPVGWMVTGLAHVGDERSGARATAVICSGPSPLGGPADMVLVAEESGLGLGARLAGLAADPDPPTGPAEAKVHAAGHPTALWPVPGTPDRAAFVGEACARWLWVVFWPESASLLVVDDLLLHDLHDLRAADPGDGELPFGADAPCLNTLLKPV